MTVKVTGFFYGEKECLMGKSFFIVAALVLTLGCAKAQVDPASSLDSVGLLEHLGKLLLG